MNELTKGSNSRYFTEFECKSLDNRGRNLEMGHDVCFSRGGGGFSKFLGNQEFTINIYKGLKKSEDGYNHSCFFSAGEILEHVEALKLVTEEDEFVFLKLEETEDLFSLNFRINSEFKIVFSFCLTWIRYLWEKPYIIATLESRNLKEFFPDMDPFTRFNLARATIPFRCCWGTGHSAIQIPGKLYKPEILKEKIHGELELLNHLYPRRNSSGLERFSMEAENFKGETDLEFWTTRDIFMTRLDVYKHNLEIYEKET